MSVRDPLTLSGMRVLVVDDEYFIADHVQSLLEDAGCIVVGPYGTVETALAAVRADSLDGAVLDANLVGLSSAAVAGELQTRGVPFVVVTGYGKSDLPIVLRNAPRLSKPFNDADFDTLVATAFLRR